MESIINISIFAIIFVLVIPVFIKYPHLMIYVFFAFGCILPSYFGVEVSESLPILTGSRMLILLLAFYVIINKNKMPVGNIFKEQRINSIFWVYFLFRIIAECYHIVTVPSEVLKELFSIFFEELMLVYLIVKSVNTRLRFEKCLKIFIYGGVAVLMVGIFQSITGINLFSYLNRVNREMLDISGTRLGFVRANASFGHPVYFGQFCVLLLPLISFMYDNSRKTKYLCFLVIDIVALILSNSRGAIIPGIIIVIVMVLQKERNIRWRYTSRGIVGFVFFAMISLIVTPIGNTVFMIIKSILNTFGASFILDEYGGNESGLDSRALQLSGISWIILNEAIWFGLGPNAHLRGLVSYFFLGRWQSLPTIDVGYIGFFLFEGIVGSIGYLTLIFGLPIRAYGKRNRNDVSNLNNTFFLCFLAYALLLMSAVGLKLTFWVLISLFISYNNVLCQEANERKILEDSKC
jgi:hypothetical protein